MAILADTRLDIMELIVFKEAHPEPPSSPLDSTVLLREIVILKWVFRLERVNFLGKLLTL